jgi:hypothetical protein
LDNGIDISVSAPANDVSGVSFDPEGRLQIETEDGGVIVDLNPPSANKRDPAGAKAHDANLAEYLGDSELSTIASDLARGIQFDEQSRTEWLSTRAQGLRLLGLKIEQPKSGIDSSTALDGMSTVRHPLLLEAVLRFQANARGELMPAGGPVKVSDLLRETALNDQQSQALEDDFNYYLTSVATEYYPDTDRLLFYVGFGGCGFKKVYNCPIRNRPVSESIDAKDLIVSDFSTDLRNCARVTHQIKMRPSTLKRMQLAGAYRDVPISEPAGQPLNVVDQQIANTQGIDPNSQQGEDRDHTIYEVYCELNIPGFEHKDKNGDPTGLALPYRVVLEKDSQQVLEVRRNWKEEDEARLPRICFVKYPFVPAFGFYDIGLVHILGNTTNALTAAWREMLDAGMFANFPGFLVAKGFVRQNTNEMRVAPGSGTAVDTQGLPITDAVMPLPYKDPSVAFQGFIKEIGDTGQRIGGTAEINVAEGNAQAPVGTTLALIEQAMIPMAAVHKRLHAAQAEEFQLLKECFQENPQAMQRAVAQRGKSNWNEAEFLAALDNADLVPQADPNTPSHMHRLMKAMAIAQLDGAYPGLYDKRAVNERILSMIKVPDANQLFAQAQPGAQPPNPELLVKAQELKLKQDELQQKPQLEALKAHNEAADNAAKERMQARESADQAAQRATQTHIAEIGLQEARIDALKDAHESAVDLETARLNTEKESDHG